jgi:1-deoxy-D-xylulose-5-phosphate synthase
MMETCAFGEKWEHARPMLDEYMQELAKRDPKFYLISPDVARAGMPEFIRKFPKQYFNTGIAEMSAMDVAAGMALEGMHPVSTE